jgi:hypothetical protein
MMPFIRGIDGKVKLNLGLRLWGGLTLLLILAFGGFAYQIDRYLKAAELCRASGGTWIGNALIRSSCVAQRDGSRTL